MHIEADMAWLIAILLISIRIGAVFLFTPVFSSIQAPAHFRVLFILALSVLVAGSVKLLPVTLSLSLGNLIAAALSELVIGGLFAFGLFTVFGAFMLGGKIIDLQMGFGVATLIDPATRSQAPLMGTFLNLLAVMLFFAVDGHHMLIRGLAFSLAHIPPGGSLAEMNFAVVIPQFGAMFIYGLIIVAPALFSILLLDVGLAVMARTMPQVNVFIVSIPLKIFVGLFVTAVSLHYLGPKMATMFESIFVYWQRLMG